MFIHYSSHCPFDIEYEACVLDLDKPWEEFVVKRSMNPIAHIVWDPSGSKLLIVDCEGMFEVWHMEVHSSNIDIILFASIHAHFIYL